MPDLFCHKARFGINEPHPSLHSGSRCKYSFVKLLTITFVAVFYAMKTDVAILFVIVFFLKQGLVRPEIIGAVVLPHGE